MFLCQTCVDPASSWDMTKFREGMGISHGHCEICGVESLCVDSRNVRPGAGEEALRREQEQARARTAPPPKAIMSSSRLVLLARVTDILTRSGVDDCEELVRGLECLGQREVVVVPDGVVKRYKANRIVSDCYDVSSDNSNTSGTRSRSSPVLGMNEIWVRALAGQYSREELEEYYQLLGMSLSGYADLSFDRVAPEAGTFNKAARP